MKRTLTATVLICAVAFLAVGCGLTEDKVVGKYTGKFELSAEAKAKSGASPASLQAMNSISIPLELKKDKTFTMSFFMIPIDGAWKLDGSKVILMDKPGATTKPTTKAEKDIPCQVSGDAKTITIDAKDLPGAGANGAGTTIVFTKQAP